VVSIAIRLYALTFKVPEKDKGGILQPKFGKKS
jgi:hypothetical protein